MLDQHEDLVSQYQKQIEDAEDKRLREEEEKERVENGGEDGAPEGENVYGGWNQDQSYF